MAASAALPQRHDEDTSSAPTKHLELKIAFYYTANASARKTSLKLRTDAQVAQAVERSPEKAGVGGSTPSLGTNSSATF
jgi:hypothetical protein